MLRERAVSEILIKTLFYLHLKEIFVIFVAQKEKSMAEMKYPIGIQTFSKIIGQGFAYVDKTQYIKPLISQGQYIFLSRPRRFGKSLLLSTLEAYFEGRRELFKGLAADSMDLDWTPSPVLHFDFNAENFSLDNGLELLLDGLLRDYERIYGQQSEDVTPSRRF